MKTCTSLISRFRQQVNNKFVLNGCKIISGGKCAFWATGKAIGFLVGGLYGNYGGIFNRIIISI